MFFLKPLSLIESLSCSGLIKTQSLRMAAGNVGACEKCIFKVDSIHMILCTDKANAIKMDSILVKCHRLYDDIFVQSLTFLSCINLNHSPRTCNSQVHI